MELIRQDPDPSAYLAACETVDHRHPLVAETASRLRERTGGRTDGEGGLVRYAEAAFDFVRDAVPHSFDSGDQRVAWRASDVLATRNGICYAKSHALAALLRHEGIPAALCYQKLNVVHGLIALKLPGRPWARQDPRGNKPGVDARFSLDGERLAFTPDPDAGEYDIPALYAVPPEPVLTALKRARDRARLERLLPERL
ncbi:transglutaminase-like domain-containing protein [Streptomyces sp. KL2]|uniref:transglutaminase-like domain-containing protein n=1 Tax=Streptomyces sp. KL2 TaxID=3050126 RepID=UPI0039799EDB